MISNRWIDLRRGNWDRLETLVRQVESGGLRALPGDDLREFGLLYRQTAADLSAVRSDQASRSLEGYLNQLLSRAHNHIYAGKKISLPGMVRFFARDYPRHFRRMLGYTFVALLLCLAGALTGTLLAITHPNYMRAALGPEMMGKIEAHEMWTDSILSIKPEASSAIMTNNIGVTFTTYAGGIVFGLGTLFEMFFNGYELGLVATACAKNHMALSLWSFVASHGALELPSIIIAGGAGLRLAAGFLFPGPLRRRQSLVIAGRESIRLLAGTVPLLVIAGILEAFLSPTAAPISVKFTVGGCLLTLLCVWLSEGGRERGKTVAS